MAANIVSIFETFKARSVAKADLKAESDCQIVGFMKHDRQLGATVRHLRGLAGIKFQQMADYLNIEKGTLSKKERGISTFDDIELRKIAKLLGMPRWKLYALADGVEPERLDFSDAYDVVTPGFREDILQMVRERKRRTGSDE